MPWISLLTAPWLRGRMGGDYGLTVLPRVTIHTRSTWQNWSHSPLNCPSLCVSHSVRAVLVTRSPRQLKVTPAPLLGRAVQLWSRLDCGHGSSVRQAYDFPVEYFRELFRAMDALWTPSRGCAPGLQFMTLHRRTHHCAAFSQLSRHLLSLLHSLPASSLLSMYSSIKHTLEHIFPGITLERTFQPESSRRKEISVLKVRLRSQAGDAQGELPGTLASLQRALCPCVCEFTVHVGLGDKTLFVTVQFMYVFFQIDMTSEKSKIFKQIKFAWKLATTKRSMN